MIRTRRIAGLFLGLSLGLPGCGSVPSPEVTTPAGADGPCWFEDITEAADLDFIHDPGPTGTYFMPQSTGSGCAFISDSDSTLYLYLLQNAGPASASVNRLYKRIGNGKLQDVTAGSGLDIAGYNMGAAVGDVNNDGLPDVLLTQYGGIRLFLNSGGGRFKDVTAESGLRNKLWGASAAFLDYDRDGWLDLIVVNYVEYDPTKETCVAPDGHKDFCGPNIMSGTCSKLFHNCGSASGGRQPPGISSTGGLTPPACQVFFEDVSFASGIGRLARPGFGAVCADFDGDGWTDIFVANDGKPNHLWINRRDGTFANEAVSRGIAYTAMGQAFAGMGVALGDVDNDGLFDVYVTHLTSETNTLWKQSPRGQFRDRTRLSGLTSGHWRGTGFGTLLADFDLDGGLDLAVVNGRVLRGGSAKDTDFGFWETYAERNQLFANDGAGKFRDVSPANPAFCGRWNMARGLACADFDDDGAPDLLVTTIGSRARLFRNVAPNRGHWLKVRILDPKCNDPRSAEDHLRQAQASPLARKRATIQLAALARIRGDRAAAANYERETASLPDDPPWPGPFREEVEKLRVGHYEWLRQESQLENQHRYAEAATLYLQEAQTNPTARAFTLAPASTWPVPATTNRPKNICARPCGWIPTARTLITSSPTRSLSGEKRNGRGRGTFTYSWLWEKCSSTWGNIKKRRST